MKGGINCSAYPSRRRTKRWPNITSLNPHCKPRGGGCNAAGKEATRICTKPDPFPCPGTGDAPGARPAFGKRAHFPESPAARRSPAGPPRLPPAFPLQLSLGGGGSATSTSGSGRCWRPLVCPPACTQPRTRVPRLARTGSMASSRPYLGAVGWAPQPSTQAPPRSGPGGAEREVPNLHPDPSPRPLQEPPPYSSPPSGKQERHFITIIKTG